MIHIVLFEPEIPQNTGNIMRTCVAMNCQLHLIEPLGFSLDQKHLRRAGLDYMKDLTYTLYPDWDDFYQKHQGNAFYFITRYGQKAPNMFAFDQVKSDIYLIFGKESTGIPKSILQDHLETCIRLPMIAHARSMNLSNCVAIMAYEVNKQLDYPKLVYHETIKGEDYLK